MSWTDERVELLKKMWQEGKSASQIAAELANGITRNAVIGKVHRLGFAGRAKSPSSPAPRARPPKIESGFNRPPGRGSGGPISIGANALAYSPDADIAPAARPLESVVIPMSERVTILELRESMCKWPLGDPTTPEFRYCGSPSPIGASYCGPHSRIAYQPAQDRRRDRRPPRRV
jgi:GcrA cell cycle regulator